MSARWTPARAHTANGDSQRRATAAALRCAELTVPQLWMRFFALGGMADPGLVADYLQGDRPLPEVQADLHDMLQAIPVLQPNIDHSNAQHRTIVAAVLAGDAVRARRAMEHHCDDTAALLRGLLG